MTHNIYKITVSTKNLGVFFEKIEVLTTNEYNAFVSKAEKMGFTVIAKKLEYSC